MPVSPIRPARRSLCIFAALVVAVLLIHLPGLGLWPIVNHDEVALNDAAWHWVSHGSVAMPLLAGKDPTYATNYLWHPPAHLLTMALAYRIFGLSIYVTRGESLLFAALATGMLFLVTQRLSGSAVAGVIAAFLLAAHPLWLWLARSGRMDPEAVCVGLAAWLVLLAAGRDDPDFPRPSVARAAMAGLIVGLAGLYHIVLLIWAPALAAALYVRHRKPGLLSAIVLWAAAALPAAGWLLWVACTGRWHAWVVQFWDYQVMQRGAHRAFLERPWLELRLFIDQFRPLPFMGLAALAGFAAWVADLRRTRQTGLLAGFLVALAAVVFVLGKGTGAYPLYWYVWLAVAAGIGWQRQLLRSRAARLLLGAAVLNALLFMAVNDAAAYRQRAARSQERVGRFLKASLRPHSIVLGTEELWYATNAADCTLHIWEKPDPQREDYYITPRAQLNAPPPGFRLAARLPDIMPRILGHTGWYSDCAYDVWESIPRAAERSPGTPDTRLPTVPDQLGGGGKH